MFGFKKTSTEPLAKIPPETPHDIAVIPDIFYGGNDPDIYNPKEPKKEIRPSEKSKEITPPAKPAPVISTFPSRRVSPPPLPPPSAEVMTQIPPPALSSQQITQPAVSPLGRKKIMVIIGLVIVLLALVAATAWVFLRSVPSPDQTPQPSEDVVSSVPVVTPLPVLPPVVTTTSPPTTPTSLVPRERSLPPVSFFTPLDTDSDRLTAAEEEIFATDPEVWDSDGDGYYDGQEVFNLYNPKGLAPMRIIDSGLVQEYVNSTWQYRVYYPISWQATPIDARSNNEVLFNAITGDYIEIKVYEKIVGESFPGWFARVVSDQIYTDLVLSTNRFSQSYYRRKDGLVSYFDTPGQVYIFILYSRDDGSNDFTHILDMMVQSFRPRTVTAQLPPQPVLPVPGEVSVPAGTVSSTGVSTSSGR